MNNEIISGSLWILGDDINTDDIVPSHVLTCQDESKIINATLEFKLPNFSCDVSPGDWIMAGKNFGCGSSREEAVFVLKELRIGGIIAQSFARIFFRNAINLGLPVITLNDAPNIGDKGDNITVHLTKGIITNLVSKKNYQFEPFPEFIQEILSFGGLLSYLQQKSP